MRLWKCVFIWNLLYHRRGAHGQILRFRAAPVPATSALDDPVPAKFIVLHAGILYAVIRPLHHFRHSDHFLVSNDVRWQVATVDINNLVP